MKKNLFKVFFIVLLITCSFVYGTDPDQYGDPFSSVPNPMDINMYQVHLRPYSFAGNFAGAINRLDDIQALGINVIYLMPFYPVGEDAQSSDSPYCIKDFKSVGEEYGTLTDLRNLVDGAHARGMAVIIDWVVNQTSWDHSWITDHPDWYVRVNGVIQPLNPFTDVAALDFNNTSMREEMINCMRYWVFAANIDGFRCDYANNAPLDFWSEAITNLRGITTHDLLLFAEGDRLENFNAGFDLNFGDKWYYDAIKPIAQGGSVSQIATTTNTEYTYASNYQQVVRYTSNHDTETSETALNVFGGHNEVIANFLVSAYMRGVPFLTSGQEVDFNQTIPWPYTSVDIDWNTNTGASADFSKILNYRTASTAIRRGAMTDYSNNNVCAFTKTYNSEKVVVMVNMRNYSTTFTVPSNMAGTYKDAFTGVQTTITSGSTKTLLAFEYLVLTNSDVTPVDVTGVSVSPVSASISEGLTQQLTATISPSNASNQTVTWSSSNSSVATVNSSGLITGISVGTATITCTTADGGFTASCPVTVTEAPEFTVHFYKPDDWGSSIKIYYWNMSPSGILETVYWPGVDMTSEGNNWYKFTFTNITSTNLIFNDGSNQTVDLSHSPDGWYMSGTWYNSQPQEVSVIGVSVSPSSASIAQGATEQLTATVMPTNATNKLVSWSSSNTGVATVNSTGLVTGVSAGNATITVTTNDGNYTATGTITVTGSQEVYYYIVNRWKGTYMYDNGTVLSYDSPNSSDYRYHLGHDSQIHK